MNFSHFPSQSSARKRVRILFILCASLLMAACASLPKPEDIPADLSPAKFFQKVQESVDAEQYDVALFYLDEFRKRFGTSTGAAILDKMLEADYVTAQINYKKGKLAEARTEYQAILKQYADVPNEAVSPPRWIKILCGKMIAVIDKKLADAAPKPSDSPNPAPTAGTEASTAASPASTAQPASPAPTPSPKA